MVPPRSSAPPTTRSLIAVGFLVAAGRGGVLAAQARAPGALSAAGSRGLEAEGETRPSLRRARSRPATTCASRGVVAGVIGQVGRVTGKPHLPGLTLADADWIVTEALRVGAGGGLPRR